MYQHETESSKGGSVFPRLKEHIMDYSRLEKGIMDFIQEEQVKLGYRKEKIRLYYPLSSLKHFLGEEDRKSTRQNSSHGVQSRMPSSA